MQKEIVKANIVVFIASFCTLVIELVAGRILAPYVGVSLYTWTSIIGVVLAGISVGAYLGGLLADRYPHQATLGWLLFLSGLGAFAIAPLTNLIGGAEFQTSLMARILLITTLIFFVPSCLLGMISPVVVKLALNNLEKTGNVVGKIYAFSTLGSILGTFATGFFLISWMGTRSILLTMGIILVVSAPVFGGFFLRKKTLTIFFSLLLMIVLLGALSPYLGAAVWPAKIARPSSPLDSLGKAYKYAFEPVLEDDTYFYKESNYYTIKLKKTAGEEGGSFETLVLDHLIHSYTDLKNPSNLEYEYVRMYEEVLRWQAAKRPSFNTMFIGGGGYTFPRFISTKYPRAAIDVVEIDPEVTRVGQQFLGISEHPRIRTFNMDARWFVMNSKEEGKYDFVFGDAFNDLSVPYHLTTLEFTRQLRALMKPNGLFLVNLIDSFKKGIFLPSYLRTLEEVFGKGNVHLMTYSSNYDNLGISTFVIVASPRKLDMENFTATIRKEKGDGMICFVMPPERLQQYLSERPGFILTDDYVPVDNLIAPIFEERFGYRG
jgi:spermidine synthase